MKNLARHSRDLVTVEEVTEQCRSELVQAGIDVVALSEPQPGEVPSMVRGELNGWTFTRLWYYWSARTDTMPLPMDAAKALHAAHGSEVRVDGHCACPAPDEWWKQPGSLPDRYYIDTDDGLAALARVIRDHAAPWTAEVGRS